VAKPGGLRSLLSLLNAPNVFLGRLVTDLPKRKAVYSALVEALAHETALVAVCEGQVVGFASLSLDVDLQTLGTNFELEKAIELQYHHMDSFAELTYLVLNPIFAHRRRLFLSEMMRLVGASCLVISVGPHALAPELVLPDFVQVRATFWRHPASS
jgi:hypothetical protein